MREAKDKDKLTTRWDRLLGEPIDQSSDLSGICP
jgi:hypothetical protein